MKIGEGGFGKGRLPHLRLKKEDEVSVKREEPVLERGTRKF